MRQTGVLSQFFTNSTTDQCTTAHLVKRCLQDSCRPLKASYKVTLIWRPSILKYNYRMAQTTQWSPAILDYMKNVRLTYQHPTTTHPVLTSLLRFSKGAVKKTCTNSHKKRKGGGSRDASHCARSASAVTPSVADLRMRKLLTFWRQMRRSRSRRRFRANRQTLIVVELFLASPLREREALALVLVATRLFAIELRRCRRRSTKFWHEIRP